MATRFLEAQPTALRKTQSHGRRLPNPGPSRCREGLRRTGLPMNKPLRMPWSFLSLWMTIASAASVPMVMSRDKKPCLLKCSIAVNVISVQSSPGVDGDHAGVLRADGILLHGSPLPVVCGKLSRKVCMAATSVAARPALQQLRGLFLSASSAAHPRSAASRRPERTLQLDPFNAIIIGCEHGNRPVPSSAATRMPRKAEPR